MVAKRWARGHWARVNKAERASRLTPLPGPDVDDDDLDMGLLEPEESHGWEFTGNSTKMVSEDGVSFRPARNGDDGPPDDEESAGPDRPPGHLSAPTGSSRDTGRKVRVTATTRKDISAKVGLMLIIPGKIWEARDPWCGSIFVRQEPEIRDALTDLICDSADLVAWFTGPAGGFMKYLNLLTAVQPVAMTIWAHHIVHTVGSQDGQGPARPDMAAYAA